MNGTFSLLDWAIVAGYGAFIVLVGVWAGRRQRNIRDYFLGGRSIPWWAAGLSIIATETSVVTFIGVPGHAYKEGTWAYVLMAVGSVLARILLAYIFIGIYYRLEVYTVYGFLKHRIGGPTRTATSGLFTVARALASGLRLYGAGLALKAALGVDETWCIVIIGVIVTIYTLLGGIHAVVWTDVILGITFIGGGLLAIGILADRVPGGFLGAWETSHEGKHWMVLNPSLDPTVRDGVLVFLLGGLFLTLASHGTDQDMVQRMLTCRDSRSGRLSLISSAALHIPIVVTFLAIGTLLWAFYQGAAVSYDLPAKQDEIFPTFIVNELGVGLSGILMAALLSTALSSTASVLTALASTTVVDLLRPFWKGASARAELLASRIATLWWSIVIIAVALAAARLSETLLEDALMVMTFIYGSILGVFLLGLWGRRGNDPSAITGLVVGPLAVLAVHLSGAVPWPWYTLIGAVVTFGIGAMGRKASPAG